MEVRGSLKEASSSHVLAYGASNQTTLTAHASSTTHTLTLPQLTGADTIVSRTSTDTLTNKTLTSPKLTSGGAGTLVLAASSVSADRTLTLQLNDADRSVNLGGDMTTAGALTTSGAYALTLTATAATNVTLPTTGTLATLAGAETLTNKTLTAPAITSPTGLVKADVGLGNVDNTSDATKDAAVATLTNKTLTAPVINAPTGLVKADVGLGNVDDTSDATKNSATATLTNKTLQNPIITDSNEASASAAFDLTNLTAARTFSLPDSATQQTLVGQSAAATLTNKTLVSPVLTNPTLSNGNIDVSPARAVTLFPGMGANDMTLGGTTSNIVVPGSLTLKDKTDATKIAMFDVSGITTGTTRTLTLPDATDTLVGLAATQTLTSKTLTTPVLTSPSMTGALTITEGSAPSSPASGKLAVYAKTDDKLYLLNSSGVETAVGAGAGEKNYVAGSSTASGWTASGAGITVTTDTTAADLPRPNTTATGIKFTGVSGSTAYAYYRFILDDADAGKKLKVQFDMKPVSGYAASDFKVDVYSNTASDYTTGNTRLSLSTDSSAVSALPNLTGTYRTTFDAPAVSAKWIEVRIGMNATHTHSLVLSDVVVGPGVVVQGAAVTAPQAYTPTFNGMGTPTNVKVTQARDGVYLVLQGSWSVGTPTAASTYFSLPSGLHVDYTNIGAGKRQKVGTVDFGRSAASGLNATGLQAAAVLDGSDTSNIYITEQTTSQAYDVPRNGSTILNAGDMVSFSEIRVPIAEWAGSGTVNVVQNDVEYASVGGTWDADSSVTVYGPDGSAMAGALTAQREKTVTWQSPIQATDSIFLQINNGSGWTTVPHVSFDSYHLQNTTTYGVSIRAGGSTTTLVNFGQYARANGATYGSAGLAWGTNKWRVVKASGGQAVGFSEVQPGISSGLVSASGLKGRTDGAAVAAGYVGQVLTSTIGTAVVYSASSTFENVTTLSLTAGIWLASASLVQEFNNATSPSDVICVISGYSATTTTDHLNGFNIIQGAPATSNSSNAFVIVPFIPVRCDGTNLYIGSSTIVGTTLYMKSRISYSGTAPKRGGTLTAVRIA